MPITMAETDAPPTPLANTSVLYVKADGFFYSKDDSGNETQLGGVGVTFVDSTAIVKGSADATKLFRIEVDGFTAGQTRVFTPPDANLTITAAAGTVLDDTTVGAMVNTLGGATSSGTGGLVRIDSAALTGTPTAPTAALATNTTQIATTAFVLANSGSGNPFDDGTALVKGSGDATKLLRIEVDGISAGTTRVWTAPNYNLTVAGFDVSQTFTMANTFSANGAASTPALSLTGTPFAGTGTTSFGLLALNETGATASTTLSTAGTYIWINAHGSGDLMNLMKDGVSQAKISNAGVMTATGAVNAGQDQTLGWAHLGRVNLKSPDATALNIFTGNSNYAILGIYNSSSIGAALTVAPSNPGRLDITNGGYIGFGGAYYDLGVGNVYGVQGNFTSNATGTTPGIFKGFAGRTVTLVQLKTSAGASLGNVGGCVFDDFADVATTHTDGTTFDTLSTYTLPANGFQINGDKLVFDYTLTIVNHTTAEAHVKLSFAGITLIDTGAVAITATATSRVFGYITRKTSTTCRATVTVEFFGSATIVGLSQNAYVPEGTLTGLTLTGTNNLVLAAVSGNTGAASGDIILVQSRVYIHSFGS